ncbi:TolC family protein [Zunongwangia sp. HRR-M8]|uniref:TolC family protein n=1 Tax=Zunongwangia sp. HRR-M8 TaxID=3015170 RepID=UPI0022DD0A28|nr:efflux transporter outer membrane subunit [Zunongwangia sp. HRR-M8]WBL22780.1 efflux transporter outer membrane subunit [Zunongwangia sp. HRR-M8]
MKMTFLSTINTNRIIPSTSCVKGLLGIFAMISVVSCKVGEEYTRPEFKEDISAEYYSGEKDLDSMKTDSLNLAEIDTDTIPMSEIPWKEYIEDSTLQSLIDTALVNNIDLKKAMKNMEIGMEELAQSKANFFPSLNARPADYRRDYYSENYNNYGSNRSRRNHGENPPSSLYTERLEYSSALQANWELDLWGKLRWQKEAARADFMKSKEFKKAVQTSLIAEVASTYFNLVMLKSQIEVAQKNYALNDSTLNIVQLQYDAGESTSLAIQQTKSQKLKAKTLIPQLEREYVIMENKLNRLLGRSPRSITIPANFEDIEFQKRYNTGIPLELVKNRPDVAMSEYELIAANADAGVANALRYPSLTIGASAGLNSFELDEFLDPVSSGFALLNGAIFQPIFNNRKLKTNYNVALSQKEIAQLDFKGNLIEAIADVSNSLAKMEKLKEEYNIAEERIEVTQKGLKDAGMLFRGGYANYLEVLTAQSDALESELNLINIKKQLLIANVELYRNLGGGWQ